MCENKITMYLAPAPIETGQDTPCKAYATLLSMRKLTETNDMYYCFWGLLDFKTKTKTLYDSLTKEEQNMWVKIDENVYARKETNFTVVPGYENVPFSKASDKSLYHPGSSSIPYQDIKIEADDTRGDSRQKRDRAGKMQGQDAIVGDTQQGRCIYTTKNSYILYCTPEPFNYLFKTNNGGSILTRVEKQYLFQLLEVPHDSMVPWTYTNRMGVFKANYGKYDANNYTLSVIDGGTKGIVWGMGENTSFLREDVSHVI